MPIRIAVLVSLVAGVGICGAYGFALLGIVREREHYDSGDVGQAAIYGLTGLVGLAITLGGIALGLIFVAKD